MRENHPRHRQALKALRKREAKRGRLPRVLIGCEGETERKYFNEFRRAHGLRSLAITFVGEGCDPKSLLKEVGRRFEDEEGDFSEVYCVFDRDDHFHFDDTCRRIVDMGKLAFKRQQASLKAITSIPSFELWLLLHFEETSGEIHRDEALKQLKKACPRYEKAIGNSYALTHANLDMAIARAKKLETGKNPSTEVGQLILRLRELWDL